MTIRKILVATDGSASSDRAATFAAQIAVAFDGELLILTVSEEAASSDVREFSDAEHATIGDILEAKSRKTLSLARTLVENLGARVVGTEVEAGDPATAILDAAKTVGAEMIVMGKRGRGHLEGLLLGSVSQKLATLARCPVVIVP